MKNFAVLSPTFWWRAVWMTAHRLLRAMVRPLVNVVRSLACRSFIHPLACLDRNVKIGRGCIIGFCRLDTMGGTGKIEIGDRTIVYNGVEVLVHGGTVTIGSDCLITRRVAIIPGGHRCRRRDRLIREQGIECADIRIGNDCWLGYAAVILKGVTVGDGAVVGALSVVTRDVPPYTMVGGSPAKPIGERTETGD
ncbi:MAG: acyltransferase [Planctomycetota bacterium]|nr:acyltransferase [Planctomycetota bacterium]